MAKYQVYDGNALRFVSLRVGEDVLPDTPVRVGLINGYTETDSYGGDSPNNFHSSQAAEFATCATKGAFHVRLDVAAAVAEGAQGTPVYIEDGELTLSAPADPEEDGPGVVWGVVLDDALPQGTDVRVLVAIVNTF